MILVGYIAMMASVHRAEAHYSAVIKIIRRGGKNSEVKICPLHFTQCLLLILS
ncbi:hypothetical protein NTGHW29_740034 [Candidatus Nitrotoga sp. HW29]|nr:hypothetical protein NTGHW29_740034 [Candidatus Nitrotoga sp. HW29]